MSKKEETPTDNAATPKKKGKIGRIIFMFFSLILGAVFLPTSIILVPGMIPTLVAKMTAQGGGRINTLTVGAMNFAGCVPFLLQLWTADHSVAHAEALLKNLTTMAVIWSAAAVGYAINWATAGIVKTALIQRANMQMKDLKKRQVELIERWGPEVKGDTPLDADGFPAPVKSAGTK